MDMERSCIRAWRCPQLDLGERSIRIKGIPRCYHLPKFYPVAFRDQRGLAECFYRSMLLGFSRLERHVRIMLSSFLIGVGTRPLPPFSFVRSIQASIRSSLERIFDIVDESYSSHLSFFWRHHRHAFLLYVPGIIPAIVQGTGPWKVRSGLNMMLQLTTRLQA